MKIIVIDRDGVVNEDSEYYIKDPDEWNAIPGSLEAIAKLNRAGYSVVIATNQAGIERKLFNMTTLNEIHTKMYKALREVGGQIKAIFYCPCLEGPACACRKPKPGMLIDIAKRFNADPASIAFIGDSLRDLQAAVSAGYQPVLVLTGNGQRTKKLPEIPANTITYNDLAHAAKHIINQS